MPFLSLSPVAVSFLLLAAHFMHAHQMVGVGIALTMVTLLAFRRPWVTWVTQIALALASLEWLHTALLLVQERQALGHPFIRLVVILSAVALATLLSCLVFRLDRVKSYYQPRFDTTNPHIGR